MKQTAETSGEIVRRQIRERLSPHLLPGGRIYIESPESADRFRVMINNGDDLLSVTVRFSGGAYCKKFWIESYQWTGRGDRRSSIQDLAEQNLLLSVINDAITDAPPGPRWRSRPKDAQQREAAWGHAVFSPQAKHFDTFCRFCGRRIEWHEPEGE